MASVALTLVAAITSASAYDGKVPAAARPWRRAITAQAHAQFGPAAPVAVFPAQLEQESGFRPDALSPVGARGMAQFMALTARDMAERHPDACAPANPLDPRWAIRCAIRYDKDLHGAITAATECDRWAMTLSAYNGGLGWVYRDQRAAAAAGADRKLWWGSVERYNAGRSQPAFRENRGYPRRILRVLAPNYVAAGWGDSPCTSGDYRAD